MPGFTSSLLRALWVLGAALGLTAPLQAFWIALPLDDSAREAEVVAVVKYESYAVLEHSELFSLQHAKFRLVRAIKGSIEAEFTVVGGTSPMCVPQHDFSRLQPGEYLMFLYRRPDGWGVVATDPFWMRVEQGRVPWQRLGRKPVAVTVSLRDAERDIRAWLRQPGRKRAPAVQ